MLCHWLINFTPDWKFSNLHIYAYLFTKCGSFLQEIRFYNVCKFLDLSRLIKANGTYNDTNALKFMYLSGCSLIRQNKIPRVLQVFPGIILKVYNSNISPNFIYFSKTVQKYHQKLSQNLKEKCTRLIISKISLNLWILPRTFFDKILRK